AITMHLILCRHGDTFRPGERVVWVGARSDLPLVATGARQARDIGSALKANHVVLSRIYAGPLSRTKTTADLIASELQPLAPPITIADELTEIDYGAWEGKTNEEIRASGGEEALAKWELEAVWPPGFNWAPGEDVVLRNLSALLERATTDNGDDSVVALISSNGLFRLLAKSLALAPASLKMATGAMSLLEARPNGLKVLSWNQKPNEFRL
ncbi:MAG TPA: histidine phosphatase family protein, partial [Rhodomicrobium sp.]|nr:histidine phosphatase family protein [Rhodomicrobium sp.]